MRRPHESKRPDSRLLASNVRVEQQVPSRQAPQENVQPAVAADESAGDAEVADWDVGFGHGGHAAEGEWGCADDVDDGVEEEGHVVAG